MSLTTGSGPLAVRPAQANYTIDGPAHRLFFEPHPRRVRAVLAGRTVLDTVRGRLVHESNLLPVLYVPIEDLDASVLEPTDHRTHCPFKGDASYWSLRVGNRVSENAVWTYREPLDAASWLAGYAALYWHRVDAWYEEDDEVRGHLRDPYHRVDARPSSRRVEVVSGDTLLAESERAVLVFETNLPVRAYMPRADVQAELVPSGKRTVCPYKGEASYWSVRLPDGSLLEDAVWSYETGRLLDDGPPQIADLVAFLHDDVEVRIAEGQRAAVGAR
ncbi:MAG TPA: DUF427 domain-containing protein [Solirubrobacteraceae bacterium]|jgi:uncharacterized protein (DUF427 family)